MTAEIHIILKVELIVSNNKYENVFNFIEFNLMLSTFFQFIHSFPSLWIFFHSHFTLIIFFLAWYHDFFQKLSSFPFYFFTSSIMKIFTQVKTKKKTIVLNCKDIQKL